MANLCTRIEPAGTVSSAGYTLNANGGNSQLNPPDNKKTNGSLDIGTKQYLWIPIGGAFDADLMGIQCQAFSNAAISVVSLQSSMTNMQAQMTALISGSEVRAPNPEIIEAQAIVFGAVLTAGVLIWGGKRIYHLFMHPPGSGDKE